MSALELRQRYRDDQASRAAFKKFILDIHGLDFTEWETRGYWDERYTPFSYFDGGRIVSSVCIYLLDAVVRGRQTKLVQISGVGTDPAFRRQGLSRELTEIGLAWAEGQHEGVFLFADTDAMPYYDRCGFTRIEEFLALVEPPTRPKAGRVKPLDATSATDLSLIYDLARRRAPVSQEFAVLSARLLMFHVLYTMRDNLQWIPDLDCLVLCARKGDTLSIYDVVAEQMPDLDDVYAAVGADSDRRIELHFAPDQLGAVEPQIRALSGNHPYVRDGFPFERPIFPYTARA